MNVIRDELIKNSDKKHAKFETTLCPDTNKKILGIKIPILRDLSKRFIKEYELEEILKLNQNEYLEEIILEGMVIGYAHISLDEKLEYIRKFIPKIDSWKVTDYVIPTFKFQEEDLEKVWEFILPYLKSDKEFEVRFAVVVILDYYITELYIDKVIKLLDEVNHEGYYAKMAVAWTLSVIAVKFNDKFMKYFKNNNLDKFTHNKTIQKMCESYRVKDEQKDLLRSMRRK